jgi:pimeloyl-ACP methyl ester carboxylesterase
MLGAQLIKDATGRSLPFKACEDTANDTMSWFEHNQAKLFYTDEGSGNPVLLLHGWACDSHDWNWQIPVLLSSGYRVIALDHRGHGRSTVPPSPSSYKPQTLADDAAALLSHLQASPAIVIGHSMGTVIASALSIQHPHLVKALVLIDPVYHTAGEHLVPFVAAMSAPNAPELAKSYFAASFYTPTTPAFLKTWHMRRALGTPQHVHEGCIAGLFGVGGVARREVAEVYLRQRRAPRLAVYANEEKVEVERGLPSAGKDEICVLGDAGHWLHQQRSEEFNVLLLKWLKTLEAVEV